MTVLRDDILDDELTQEQAKVIVKHQFDSIIESAHKVKGFDLPRSRTPGAAKDVYEFCDLVRQSIEHREQQKNVTNDARVIVTQETSDLDQKLETITFSLEKRQPGQFSEGPPFGGDVRNLRPILRESMADPDNPGYRKVIMGYWYDNLVRFTCWARTNKQANQRALWFEELMEDYTWVFRVRGVSRVLFWDRGPDVEKVVDTTSSIASSTMKYYGRPLFYYVRTEKIRTYSEKELEQLLINVRVQKT